MQQMCGMAAGSRVRYAVVLALVAGTLTGCGTSQKIRVVAQPADSLIVLRGNDGKELARGLSPLTKGLSLKDGDAVVVDAQPSANNADRYNPASKSFNKAQFNALAVGSDNVREVTIQLHEREFINVQFIEVVVDPELGLVGRVTQDRAFKSTTEEGGLAPSKIIDLPQGLGIRGVSLSPSGERLVFSLAQVRDKIDLEQFIKSGEQRSLQIQRANLRAINLTRGGIEELTSDSFVDTDPHFTSDGRHILMASNRRRPQSADMLRIDTSGRGGIQDIYTDRTRGGRIVNPSQGKNGLIAFALFPPNGDANDAQIWTVGGDAGVFPTELGPGHGPATSPDGSKIVFIRKGDLYVMNSDGTGATQITSDAAQIRQKYEEYLKKNVGSAEARLWEYNKKYFMPYSAPSWSPDARYITFTSMYSADSDGRPNEDIYVMPSDGGKPRQLTTNRSVDRAPLFSPDGKSIYFVSNRGGYWAVWRTRMEDLGN